jgi:hypothetical protein
MIKSRNVCSEGIVTQMGRNSYLNRALVTKPKSKETMAKFFSPTSCTELHLIKRYAVIQMVVKGKGKTVPLQTRRGPEGSRKLMFPDFVTKAQDGDKVVSLTHRPPLPPGNAPGTHFC